MLARALALLVLLVTSLVAVRATAGETLAHERYALDNGLDVVLHVDRRLPIVAVNLAYHVGWMHDGERLGLAHLVEHMMFRGTEELDDRELRGLLDDADAMETNATTHPDRTSYYTIVPAEHLPVVLWLESHRMAYTAPAVMEHEVRQEVQTTIDEWELRVANEPMGEPSLELRDALFPAGHPLHGVRPSDIRRLQAADVRAFMQRHHGPANATLVLAGDLPPDVRDQVERYFGHRRGGERPPALDLAVPPRSQEQRVVHPSTVSASPLVIMAWATPGLYEPGDAEADVLASVLGAGRHLAARLETHAPGVFLDVRVAQESMVGASMFVIATRGTSTGLPLQMQTALDAVLEDLRARPLPPAAVRRARRRTITSLLRGVQRVDQRAMLIQRYIAAGKPPDWLDEDIARYEAIDELDVAMLLRSHLVPERRALLLAYPAEGSR